MSESDRMRVVNDIIDQIRAGKLRPGDVLPSIAKLAEQYKTSQTTVKNAQMLLSAQGWIYGRQGKGVYVAPNPPIADTAATDR